MSEPDYNRYLVEYRYDGADWCFELMARDRSDAEARLKAMPWARCLGEVTFSASVPASGFTKLLAGLFRSRR